MKKINILPKLKKGDTICLLSLASGLAGEPAIQKRYLIAKQRLQKWGFKIVSGKHALKGLAFLNNNKKARIEDFHNAFLDPKIKAIFANIGGFDSYQIINNVDPNIIKKHPKILLGYSDITTWHLLMLKCGIQSYYGPNILDNFAENEKMHDITKQSVISVLINDEHQVLKSSPWWTSEYLDWFNKKNNQIKRKMQKEIHGHIWLNFKNDSLVEGMAIGGCVEVLFKTKNTIAWPKTEFFKDAILFLENSEVKTEPEKLIKMLNFLKPEIKLAKCLIIGKPKDEKYFIEYLKIYQSFNIPLVFNINIGHCAPIYTIPYYSKIIVEPKLRQIKIINN